MSAGAPRQKRDPGRAIVRDLASEAGDNASMRRPGSFGRRWAERVACAALACAALAGASGCGGLGTRALAFEDPDGSLSLSVGTFERTCDEAHAVLLACGRWELYVNLEPEAQSGEHPLASDTTWAQAFISDGRPDGDECTMRGSVLDHGTIDITDRTDDRVSFTVTGTAFGKFDADGSYDASVCP